MTIDLEHIQDAVLQVFADLDVPAGGHLSMDVLRSEWPRMRLRRGDLVKGVRELIYAGQLELDEDINGPLLILTPAGHRRMQERAVPVRTFWNWFGMRKAAAEAPRQSTLALTELPSSDRRQGES